MAELTSTKIYGDLQVVRNAQIGGLTVNYKDGGVVIGTKTNVEDLQVISGTTSTDTVGFAAFSPTYTPDDYQYFYYKGSNSYGGMFHRQGTSNSDLRQDYNYLKWFTSSSGGTSYERFGLTTGGAVFNEDSNDQDFRIESAVGTYAISLRASDGKTLIGQGACSNTYFAKGLNVWTNNAAISGNTSVEASVGYVGGGENALLFNYATTAYSHASLDFAMGNSATYFDAYCAGRMAFVGYQTTGVSSSYNYFTWLLHSGTGSSPNHLQMARLTRDGNFHARGDIIAYSTVITSDERLKDNIITVEIDSLSKLLKLRSVNFNWKSEDKKGELSTGYIAQEFQEHFPEMISETIVLASGDEEEYMHIRYNELIPHITNAMKQQQEIIDKQQSEIDDLKEKVALLLEKL